MLCGSAYRNRGIEPLLDAMVAYLPSPLDVPAVRGVHDGAEQRRAADPDAPFAGLVFKVNASATGRLACVRVYSGTLRKGTPYGTPAADAPSGWRGSCGSWRTGTSSSTGRSPATSSRSPA